MFHPSKSQMFPPSPALLEARGSFVWLFALGKDPKLDVLNKWLEQNSVIHPALSGGSRWVRQANEDW